MKSLYSLMDAAKKLTRGLTKKLTSALTFILSFGIFVQVCGASSLNTDRLCPICFNKNNSMTDPTFLTQQPNFQKKKHFQTSQTSSEDDVFVRIEIKKGDSFWDISSLLKKANLIKSKFAFALLILCNKDRKKIKCGHYKLRKRSSMSSILRLLVKGETLLHRMTIKEGWTAWQVCQYINQHPCLKGKAVPVCLEGACLPDTYWLDEGTTREAALKLLQDKMLLFLKNMSAPKIPNGYTFKDVLILASIVEKETAFSQEKPLIASVFWNRLKKRMHLNADPTIIYALTLGQKSMNRLLSHEDLSVNSPYNTYRFVGLPPTPICCPGKDSIQAVCNAPETELLYFVVANPGSKQHRFSKDLKIHNKNVRSLKRKASVHSSFSTLSEPLKDRQP